MEALNPAKIFIGARGSALALSFGFSIIYSRLLGLENRSVLTFIFTVSSLLILGFISSLGLDFRKKLSSSPDRNIEIINYLNNLFYLTLVLSIIFELFLLIYSSFVTHLNLKLFCLSLLLFLTSGLVQGLNELLIGLDRLRTIGLLENIEILSQIIFFAALLNLAGFSIITSVMLGISLTYIISSLLILKMVLNQTKLKVRELIKTSYTDLRCLDLFNSKSLYVTLPFVILDRIDKVMIGFLLPLVILSKYSVLLVFYSLARVIPESIAKTYFSRHHFKKRGGGDRNLLFAAFFIPVFLLAYPLYIISTRFMLGNDWLLPVNIFLATALFELIRAICLLKINRLFTERLETGFKLTHISWFIGMAVGLIFISVHFVGIVGVPLSLGTTYASLMFAEMYRQRRNGVMH